MFPSHNVVIPVIDYELCQACPKCEASAHCRYKVFVRIDRDEPPFIDVARCGGCGECISYCPYNAIVPPDTGR